MDIKAALSDFKSFFVLSGNTINITLTYQHLVKLSWLTC